MLLMRIPHGLQTRDFSPEQIAILDGYLASEDLDAQSWSAGSLTLTRKGRLIADRIVRDLVL